MTRLQTKSPWATAEADHQYRRARAALAALLVGYWLLAVVAVIVIHHNRGLVAAFALGAAVCELPVMWLLLRALRKALERRVAAGAQDLPEA